MYALQVPYKQASVHKLNSVGSFLTFQQGNPSMRLPSGLQELPFPLKEVVGHPLGPGAFGPVIHFLSRRRRRRKIILQQGSCRTSFVKPLLAIQVRAMGGSIRFLGHRRRRKIIFQQGLCRTPFAKLPRSIQVHLGS